LKQMLWSLQIGRVSQKEKHLPQGVIHPRLQINHTRISTK
jgi:hypothetical protein